MDKINTAVYIDYMNQTILIADDHPLFREALRYIVNSVLPDCDVHEVTNYQEAQAQLEQNSYKLVFLDLNMPDTNGLNDLALLKKLHPQTPIVVVSGHEEVEIVRTCLKYNASGYIIKSSSPDEIKVGINTILQGNTYIPPTISINDHQNDIVDAEATNKVNSLTPSQLRILIEIGKGKLNKQIAYDLDITEATVKAHITSVFKKLKINNRTQAVLFSQEHQEKIQQP